MLEWKIQLDWKIKNRMDYWMTKQFYFCCFSLHSPRIYVKNKGFGVNKDNFPRLKSKCPHKKIIDIRNVRYDKQVPALHERQLKTFVKIKYLFCLFLVTEDEYLDILTSKSKSRKEKPTVKNISWGWQSLPSKQISRATMAQIDTISNVLSWKA